MKVILAVMCTTQALVKIRPEKNFCRRNLLYRRCYQVIVLSAVVDQPSAAISVRKQSLSLAWLACSLIRYIYEVLFGQLNLSVDSTAPTCTRDWAIVSLHTATHLFYQVKFSTCANQISNRFLVFRLSSQAFSFVIRFS